MPILNSEKRWFHFHGALKVKDSTEEQMTEIFELNFLRVFRTVLKP